MTDRSPVLPALVALALVSACTVGPDYQRPEAGVPVAFKAPTPDPGWKTAAPADARARGPWWSVFNEAELDRLMAQVEISNQNLKAAEAAYRQAHAILAEARASFLPTLDVSGSGQRSGPLKSPDLRSGTSSSSSTKTQNTFGVSFDASWGPDLWGRIRRTVEGDLASVQASAADLANARLSAQADLATAYFQLRAADEQKRLLEASIGAYQRSAEIARNRHAAGITALTDVVTADTQVRATEAQAIALGVQRAQYENAIAVLIGQPPSQFKLAPAPLAQKVPAIPAGVPSALLERRPDIASAERKMAEANAQIGIAEAAYYPDLTLSGSLGSTVTDLSSLFMTTSTIWALGGKLATTLFDGGAREAKVAAAEAGWDQQVATYRQTVLTAFKEVENQLSALSVLERQALVEADAVRLAREAERLALNQYQAGTAAYTTVLTAQTTRLQNELNALTVQQDRLLAAVALVQALGGGWNRTDLPQPDGAEAGGPVHPAAAP